MRPTDPRLRAPLRPARLPLGGVAAAGLANGLLVIAQAWAVSGLVLGVVQHSPLLGPSLALAAVLLARGASSLLGDLAAARAASVVGTELRGRLLTRLLERRVDEPRTVDDDRAALLLTRGVAAAEPYLTRYVPAVALAVVVPPLAIVAIGSRDLLSAVIVVATVPLIPLFGALVGLATRDRAEEQWRSMGVLSGHFLDVVRGLPTLVAHRRAHAQSATIARITDRYRRASLRTLRIAFASSAVLELVATLSVALVAVTVGVRLAAGGVDLPTALVVLLLAPEAYWPLRRMGAEFHAAAEGAATFAAADELLHEDDASAAVPPTVHRSRAHAGDHAPLVLDHLTVTYPGRTLPVIDRLSALIPARGITAVTGPSGCGKSTLLAALAGLVAHGGSLSRDGEELVGVGWQRQVAWSPQEPHFLLGSVADNLRLARPDAADDELWAALAEVALAERVRDLPHGLATELGEDGAGLSAGERARLALARVVLADRPWVLLDEPTAHLDDLTEQVVADTIVALARDRGIVVVAHRPRLLELADHHLELSTVARPSPTTEAAVASDDLLQQERNRRGDEVDATDPTAARPRRPLALATALGTLASASGVALTATAGWLIVQASSRPPVLTLLVAVVGVRAFGLARPVLRYAERLIAHDAALRLLAERRVAVYDALVPLVPGRLGRPGRSRGDLLTAVVDDVDSVVDRALRVRQPMWQYTGVAALAALVAAALQPAAGAEIAVGALVVGVTAPLLARAGARRAEARAVELRSRLSSGVVESLALADDLRLWQTTDRASAQLRSTSARLGRATTVAAGWAAAARAVVLAATGATMVLVAAVCADDVATGRLSGPVAALLVLIPLALADVALPLADAGALSVRTSAAADRLLALERIEPAVPDRPGALVPAHAGLRFEAASARWTTRSPATAPLTARLEPGDRVAVVGPSGSGKSTVAALALRFLDPCAGQVLLGDAPLTATSPELVRAEVGLVDDRPHVFATTLAENVRLARPDADDAAVLDALRRARLGAWAASLPDGIDTWLGTGHASISGGERARLAVARSLLADQRVLVLDEPTAHLDHATASALAQEVLAAGGDRAVLWITHDRVGLDLVDRVVVLGEPTAAREVRVEAPH
ncbi:thiol reductant ABC exporter subunit CydD [Nocardioides sp.]|uniref:thiol reductant ABC exporter subunit CydD n=1 Tax=Nocardioides sp. TaxID=35761 RepID=UPI0035141200